MVIELRKDELRVLVVKRGGGWVEALVKGRVGIEKQGFVEQLRKLPSLKEGCTGRMDQYSFCRP